MCETIVDSRRHAAFNLAYQGRRLTDTHETMFEGDEPPCVRNLVGRLDEAAFVLLAHDPACHQAYQEKLGRVTELYEMQAGLIMDGKSLTFRPGSPEPFWVQLGGELGRLEVLGRRSLAGDDVLQAWFAVGAELADLTFSAFDKLEDGDDSETDWDALSEAVENLPAWDRMEVADKLPIRWDSPRMLVECLEDAYESISSLASRPERDRSSPEAGLGMNVTATAGAGSGGPGGRDPDVPANLDDDQAAAFAAMFPSWQEAFRQYLSAAIELGQERLKDKQAYGHLQGEGMKLRDFQTWSCYLRKARKALGLSKNKPRRGRQGRSVVAHDAI